MSKPTRQEKDDFEAILDRMDDARIRYFFLMLGSAVADYCERQKPAQPARRKAAAE